MGAGSPDTSGLGWCRDGWDPSVSPCPACWDPSGRFQPGALEGTGIPGRESPWRPWGKWAGRRGPHLTLSFLRALNFFKHSTVSCLCIMEATVERCCGERGRHILPEAPRGVSSVPEGLESGGRGTPPGPLCQSHQPPTAAGGQLSPLLPRPEPTTPHHLSAPPTLTLLSPLAAVSPTQAPWSASTLHPFTCRTGPPLPGAPTFPETEATPSGCQTPGRAAPRRPGGTTSGKEGTQGPRAGRLTQTHGCFSASCAVMRLAGLMVSIWLMRFLASGVTVSHSGDGN